MTSRFCNSLLRKPSRNAVSTKPAQPRLRDCGQLLLERRRASPINPARGDAASLAGKAGMSVTSRGRCSVPSRYARRRNASSRLSWRGVRQLPTGLRRTGLKSCLVTSAALPSAKAGAKCLSQRDRCSFITRSACAMRHAFVGAGRFSGILRSLSTRSVLNSRSARSLTSVRLALVLGSVPSSSLCRAPRQQQLCLGFPALLGALAVLRVLLTLAAPSVIAQPPLSVWMPLGFAQPQVACAVRPHRVRV